MINNKLSDNDDTERETKNLFIRCNMLLNRFSLCSTGVKCVLFKTYCLCFYNIALWHHYTVTCLYRLKASYHKCIKKFFGRARMDSMTEILISLKLPSFCTLWHKARARYCTQSVMSCNGIVLHFLNLGL